MVVMLASHSLSLDYLSTQVKQMGKKLSEMNKKLATAPEDLQQQTKDFMSVSGKYIVHIHNAKYGEYCMHWQIMQALTCLNTYTVIHDKVN